MVLLSYHQVCGYHQENWLWQRTGPCPLSAVEPPSQWMVSVELVVLAAAGACQLEEAGLKPTIFTPGMTQELHVDGYPAQYSDWRIYLHLWFKWVDCFFFLSSCLRCLLQVWRFWHVGRTVDSTPPKSSALTETVRNKFFLSYFILDGLFLLWAKRQKK